jgi:hypothetical protein
MPLTLLLARVFLLLRTNLSFNTIIYNRSPKALTAKHIKYIVPLLATLIQPYPVKIFLSALYLFATIALNRSFHRELPQHTQLAQ